MQCDSGAGSESFDATAVLEVERPVVHLHHLHPLHAHATIKWLELSHNLGCAAVSKCQLTLRRVRSAFYVIADVERCVRDVSPNSPVKLFRAVSEDAGCRELIECILPGVRLKICSVCHRTVISMRCIYFVRKASTHSVVRSEWPTLT